MEAFCFCLVLTSQGLWFGVTGVTVAEQVS